MAMLMFVGSDFPGSNLGYSIGRPATRIQLACLCITEWVLF